MRRVGLAAALMLATACTPPPGWAHYITRDGRDAYTYDRPDGSSILSVMFEEGHPTLIDCTLEDC